MRFYSHHGCFEEEQVIGTNFEVDVAMAVDTSLAQKSDNLADTVNYLSVYQVVKREMAKPSHLLEHVADRVGEAILAEFAMVGEVKVRLSKLNPPLGGQIGSVSVTILATR